MSELVAGHYEGYRMFLALEGRLHSIAKDYEYEPGLNIATCRKKHDQVPSKGCGCGFWVYHREYRARQQFGDDLAPAKSSRHSAYGDFGEEKPEPRWVLGKVVGGGHAISGDDGCRIAELKIVALITDEPDLFTDVMGYYDIPAVAPRSPGEEGIITAWIMVAVDNTVTLDVPSGSSTEEMGIFLVDDGVHVPPLGSHVCAEFQRRGAMRYVTSFRSAGGTE